MRNIPKTTAFAFFVFVSCTGGCYCVINPPPQPVTTSKPTDDQNGNDDQSDSNDKKESSDKKSGN